MFELTILEPTMLEQQRMQRRASQTILRPLLLALLLVAGAMPLRAQQAAASPAGAAPAGAAPMGAVPMGAVPKAAHESAPSQKVVQSTGSAVRSAGVSEENGAFVFRTHVDEVVRNVTVIDHKQRLITTLKKGYFQVFEDNAVQKIASFRQEDVPVSLGILIDNSGSMRDKRDAVNRAALDMVKASNPEDESFLVNFSDDAFLDQDFTSNIDLLQKGLEHIDSKGGTALYDAVVASADHLTASAKRNKQVLLIITDGEDNSSSTTLQQTVRRIQDLQGPIVYTIGLLFGSDSSGEARHARKALQQLSDETGGLAYFPKSLNQVDGIASQVAADIRNQYTIGYHPTKPESQGGYRTLRVEVKAAGFHKLSARTRAGYYPGRSKALGLSGLSATPVDGAAKP